jgi:DUF438 domain-containing protein
MSRAWNELLMDDHQATERVFDAVEKAFGKPEGPAPQMIADMMRYFELYLDGCHHKKEENWLFPRMAERGVPMEGGPLAVMIAEHGQNRMILERMRPLVDAFVAGEAGALDRLRAVFHEYIGLLKDHFWKENDILYPMALRVFDDADARYVIDGIAAEEAKLGDSSRADWYALAERIAQAGDVRNLAFNLDPAVMGALLDTLPIELSFVDQDDTVRYFSHEAHDKIFPRSRSVIGRKVQDCHPSKSVHLVSRILEDFKAGRRTVAEFWIDMGPPKIHIRYFPVRDAEGRYLGCLETVQDIAPIQALTGQRRLLSEE